MVESYRQSSAKQRQASLRRLKPKSTSSRIRGAVRESPRAHRTAGCTVRTSQSNLNPRREKLYKEMYDINAVWIGFGLKNGEDTLEHSFSIGSGI